MSQTFTESERLRQMAELSLDRDLHEPGARPEIVRERRRQLLALAAVVATDSTKNPESSEKCASH